MQAAETSIITQLIFYLQLSLLPFQLIHYSTRRVDKTRLRFLLLSLAFVLFNSIWIFQFKILPNSALLADSINITLGFALAGFVYFYLGKELGLTKSKRTIIHLFFILMILEITRRTIFRGSTIDFYASLKPIFLISTFLGTGLIAYLATRALWTKKNKVHHPLFWAAVLTFCLSGMLPIFFFTLSSEFIWNFLINLPFVVIASAYFRLYFKQIKVENEILHTSFYYSKLNLDDRYIKSNESLTGFDLTKREHEIATLIVDGFSYKEIADQIFLGESTIRKHASTIFAKVGVSNLAEFKQKFPVSN